MVARLLALAACAALLACSDAPSSANDDSDAVVVIDDTGEPGDTSEVRPDDSGDVDLDAEIGPETGPSDADPIDAESDTEVVDVETDPNADGGDDVVEDAPDNAPEVDVVGDTGGSDSTSDVVDATDAADTEDSETEPDTPETNACGGEAVLEHAPDAPCGTCDSGIWICAGDDVVTCTGDRGNEARNACGGCAELDFRIGDRCGTCGSGRIVCDGFDAVSCDGDGGARALNDCGGCSTLVGNPDEPCGTCDTGTWVCAEDREAVACDGDLGDGIVNECGGCDDDPLNACGGCSVLEGVVGSPCGTCALGTLACADDGLSLVCDGDPGDEVRNECGGCRYLPQEVGTPCGTCGSGSWSCDGTERVSCEGDLGEDARNSCGGCLELDGEPGDACGECGRGTWICTGDGGIRCNGDWWRNPCGGCEELTVDLRSSCGDCGEYRCGPGDAVCVEPVECPTVDDFAKLVPETPVDRGSYGAAISVNGTSVAIASASTATPAVSGVVELWSRSGDTWTRDEVLDAGAINPSYGLVLRADELLIRSRGRFGEVLVFHPDGDSWSLTQTLTASDGELGDGFGTSSAFIGDTLVVGAPGVDTEDTISAGALYLFSNGETGWREDRRITAEPLQGLGGSLVEVEAGALVTVGRTVHEFAFGGADWGFSEQPGLVPPPLGTGWYQIATDADAFMGSGYVDDRGYVQTFRRVDGVWVEADLLDSGMDTDSDSFGFSLALDGDLAVVGDRFDSAFGYHVGAVHVFQRVDSRWVRSAVIRPPDATGTDSFGSAVALRDGVLFVGARNHSAGADYSGAVYVYDLFD